MKAAISGSTGFIGRSLTVFLTGRGWEVTALTRADFNKGTGHLANIISSHDAVVHLSGAPIIRRWTPEYKKELYSSRIDTTRRLAEAVQVAQVPPRVLVSASAVGILKGEGIYREDNAVLANDFVGRLCQDWEKSTAPAAQVSQVVNLRIGVVLDKREGALKKMLPPFRFGLGGKIGNGRQLFTWIHIDDLLSAIAFIIESPRISGPVHAAAPEVVTNRQFTTLLAGVLRKPAFIPVPSFLLYMIYGQAAKTLTEGQGALPAVLTENGFVFRYPKLQEALRNLFVQ
jgi:hypothetical protein